jgi:putative phosphoesterase
MRIAVISDIHGNRLALEAVLEDIAGSKPDLIVNLGDNLSGPVDPAGVARILRDLAAPTIRGNHDRVVAEADRVSPGPVDRFAHDALTSADLAWNAGLPATAIAGGCFFLCHGHPKSDLVHWLEGEFVGRGSVLPDESEVAAAAEGIDQPVIGCGHSHRPRVVRLSDGRMIVNPGSVGLQFVHGSPDARYALLDQRAGRWSVTQRIIPYDDEGAAVLAERNGFPQWRRALTTGWTGPEGLF